MATSPFDLTGRRALITGSGQGIGLALARALAAAGANIVLNGRHRDKLERAAADLKLAGADVHIAPFDVTDAAAVTVGIAEIEAQQGPIDILVNNAGLTRRMPLQDLPEATWREVMRTNLDAVFFVGQSVARCMIARGHGKIINVCSVQSELARPGTAPYAASKGAVKMLTKAMCADWAKHGLQVNGLAPGYFETELTRPLGQRSRIFGVALRTHPGGAVGQGGGAGWRGRVPVLRGRRLRERPHAYRGWWHDQRGLGCS